MKKNLISIIFLIAYTVILIKVMVFKDVPLIRIGQVMLNFGGTQDGQANFVPFYTILPYLLGYKGWIIAGLNLAGNIVLLIPIGFLIPFIYMNMSWKKSLAIGVATGLAIEVTQTLLRVGIFDIDDVILNALGVVLGYGAFVFPSKWLQEKNYKNILIAVIIAIAVPAAAIYAIYPKDLPVYPRMTPEGVAMRVGSDLCGGTGGTGAIASKGNNNFTIERDDGSFQLVSLARGAVIETSAGTAALTDLKIGDRVTLVGDVNSDNSFTADTVVLCNAQILPKELEAEVFEAVETKTAGVWDKKVALSKVDVSTNAAIGTWYANDAWHWLAWQGTDKKWQVLVSLDGFDCTELNAVPEEYSKFFYDTTHSPEGKLYCYAH